MKNKRIIEKIYILIPAVLMLLAAASVLFACLGNNQSFPAIIFPYIFKGEYSVDGGEMWNDLNEDASFSALDGGLILRGNFDVPISSGSSLNFYLDHITAEIYVNGELSFVDSRTLFGPTASGCCRDWMEWITPEIGEDDIVEIHLDNYHNFGNKNAYNEFLGSLYFGSEERFSSFMLKTGQVERYIGVPVTVIAVMLLSVSAAFWLLRIDGGKPICLLGLLALSFGVWITLDTVDLLLWSGNHIFNTYGISLSMMLAAIFAVFSAADMLKTPVSRVAKAAAAVLAAVDAVLLVLSITGAMLIYDTWIYRLVVSLAVFAVVLGCCVYEFVRSPSGRSVSLISYTVLIASLLADAVLYLVEYDHAGVCSKVVFLALFLMNLVIIIKVIPADYRSARKTEKLEAELADSRISIMLSQIQPHFLYNALNSIYYLCDKDPTAAKQAISDFADYLRGNMDSLSRTGPVPFYMELKHLQTYLTIEKMRFEDTLNIEWDIQTKEFMIPPLTVQPLVENAVKHGVCRSEDGGTVWITTRECADHFEVEIKDNGVGFDVGELKSDGKSHIGIENVRNRLWKMCGATLEITSEKGKGTTALIRLPKKEGSGDRE